MDNFREAVSKAPPTITRFETGVTYNTRSVCDHDCIFKFTILRRTEKTVRVRLYGKEVSRRIYIYNNVARFRPFGSYSMAAVISADKK